MNNRARIIGLAIAGAAGTSGAAFAGMSTGDQHAAQPNIESATTVAGTPSSISADGTVTYQVGAAGTVEVSHAGGSLSVKGATAGAGWAVVSISGPGGHVEVQFSDTVQLVTFSADAVGDDIAVAVTNVDAAGATTSAVVAAPIEVVVVETENETEITSSNQAPAPLPATPPPPPTAPPATPAAQATSPATTQPTPPYTAAPSSGGDDDDDDDGDEYEEEHEEEHEEEGDDD